MSATPEIKHPEPEAKVEHNPLAEVVAEVRADAERRPQDYARETIVAEGGE